MKHLNLPEKTMAKTDEKIAVISINLQNLTHQQNIDDVYCRMQLQMYIPGSTR